MDQGWWCPINGLFAFFFPILSSLYQSLVIHYTLTINWKHNGHILFKVKKCISVYSTGDLKLCTLLQMFAYFSFSFSGDLWSLLSGLRLLSQKLSSGLFISFFLHQITLLSRNFLFFFSYFLQPLLHVPPCDPGPTQTPLLKLCLCVIKIPQA